MDGSGVATDQWRELLLDERYRLEQVRHERNLPNGSHLALWRAMDEPLDRRVAVMVLTDADAPTRQRLVEAATLASHVADGRCVRVLDIGDATAGGRDFTWVATEWVEGPSLAALLRREPLRPAAATELVRQCAEALAIAARDGCRHGRLHPDQVLLPSSGLPRLTGLATAAALAGSSPATASDDARGLGGLLFAALTGTWPLSGWDGLPAATDRGAHSSHPRRLRGAVPRPLDEVTARALEGGYADAQAVAQALALLPGEPLDAPLTPKPARARGVRRWAWRVVPPLLVVAVGVTGWELGSDLGRVPTSARDHRPALPPASATAPGAGTLSLVWTGPPKVSSFDPEGDGQENDDQVGLAVDRDPSTSWSTNTYRSARLGGLKDGVGLLLDLGRPTTVRVAELALTAAGSDVELRAGDSTPSSASDLALVESTDRAPQQLRWTITRTVTARYWLVWFTDLPKVSSGYRIGVAEIALLG